MDFYGINVAGQVTVDFDNSYDIGDSTHRLKNVFSKTFDGESTSALWADLAEKYKCKEIYDKGTAVVVSKDPDFDVEICNVDLATNFVGVISTKPAFKMNKQLKDGTYVALVGLVSVRVKGVIKKGEWIVPTVDGCARRGQQGEEAFKIGVANETKETEDISLIKCVIK